MSTFSNISLYDVPQVAAGQAVRDPLSVLGTKYWRKLLFDRDALTPIEREDLADAIRKGTGIGKDRITNTVLEVASNPFILLGLVTSPIGGKVLKEGYSLFSTAKKHSWYQFHMSSWKTWGRSVLENLGDSPAAHVALAKSTKVKNLKQEAHGILAPARVAMVNRLNDILEADGHRRAIKSLDMTEHVHLKGSDPVAYNLLRELHSNGAVHTMGMDAARSDSVKKALGDKLYIIRKETPDSLPVEISVDELPDYAKPGVGIGPKQAYVDSQLEAEAQRLKNAWEQYKRDVAPDSRNRLNKAQFYERNRLVDVRREPREVEFKVHEKSQWDTPLVDASRVAASQAKLGPEFQQWLHAEARAKQYMFVKYLGDESLLDSEAWKNGELLTEWAVDRDKLAMWSSAVSRYEFANTEAGYNALPEEYRRVALEGLDYIKEVLGPDRAAEILKRLPDADKGGQEAFEKALDKLTAWIEPPDWGSTRWAPRNVSKPQRVYSNPQFTVTERGTGVLNPGGDLVRPAPPPEAIQHPTGIGIDGTVSRTAYPVTDRDIHINSETLDDAFEFFGATSEGHKHRDKVVRLATNAYYSTTPSVTHTFTGNVFDGTERYVRSVGSNAAEVTTAISDDIIRSDRETWNHVDLAVRRPGYKEDKPGSVAPAGTALKVPTAFQQGLSVGIPLDKLSDVQRKRMSLGMALDREYMKVAGPSPEDAVLKRKYMMDYVRPAMGDRASEDFTAAYRSMQQQKYIARWFVNSPVGKLVSKMGEPGERLIKGLQAIADHEDAIAVWQPGKGLARYLYVTHLGANASSIVLNLTQPLIGAAMMGNTADVLGAYKDSLQNMWKYAGLRAKRGARFPTVDEKLDDMKAAFGAIPGGDGSYNENWFNVRGIGPDFNQLIDSRLRSKTSKWDRMQQILMAGFEKSEWFNRDVTANIVRRAYIRAGRNPLTDARFTHDATRAVYQFQFGQHDLNTPGIFLKGPLRHTLLRQFASFPVRSAVTMWDIAPKMGGALGTGFKEGSGAANFWLRTMAVSAFTHEVTKNLLGVNVDRGLAAQASTDVVGGGRFVDSSEFPLQIVNPPIMDIVVGAMRGFATGDEVELGQAVSRLVPGGVALSRAWGVMPKAPEVESLWGMPGKLQRTYAGWDQTLPGGLVPVYSHEGRLVGHRHWSALAARGLGIDMGAWGEQGNLDHYLTRQREEILQMRHEYLRRLRANDMSGASRVAREFGERFKDPNGRPLPLTVSRSQAKNYLRNQVVDRTERVLDRLPTEVRQGYGELATGAGFLRGLPEEAVSEGRTARERDKWRPSGSAIDQELRDILTRQGSVGRGAENIGG